ncbi:class II histone deacetylase [Nocardioides sp. cx-173]|uniref:class II histone deacetylase n=1 Tax=Nocardioides sp. cx-173 TaxID=2898796 RepID=UPI001E395A4C|nr:class II histone deacetylase [Nocardioides sp. cx-173]MCD4524039.1 class II histone deacetylase [Nocardioides sp. cx-173]UGB41440.1 class II histone deacetylase [Nocardioides sp. cx-173]
MKARRRTGWVFDERYLWHDTGTGAGPLPTSLSQWIEPMEHVESPPAKRRLANLVAVSGLLDELVPVRPVPATEAQVEAVHAPALRRRIEVEAAGGRGDAGDGSSPFGAESYRIALLAAGGVIAGVDAVLDGVVDNAYALVRPPGHHASRETGWGFCLFNNLAIAAAHARSRGLGRVAIVDWDVHHGNGTESIFAADPSVLTISLHQDGAYPPGSGPVSYVGEGPGAGTNLNVPLPPGSGGGAYEHAMMNVVRPALARFQPDLVLVASGLDGNGGDPMARQMLSSEGFRMLTRHVREAAEELCGGRLVLAHEGGYNPWVVPFCGLAVLEELSGARTPVEDPYLAAIEGYGQQLRPHQEEAVGLAAANVLGVPGPDA